VGNVPRCVFARSRKEEDVQERVSSTYRPSLVDKGKGGGERLDLSVGGKGRGWNQVPSGASLCKGPFYGERSPKTLGSRVDSAKRRRLEGGPKEGGVVCGLEEAGVSRLALVTP